MYSFIYQMMNRYLVEIFENIVRYTCEGDWSASVRSIDRAVKFLDSEYYRGAPNFRDFMLSPDPIVYVEEYSLTISWQLFKKYCKDVVKA